jgi:hypothetical protein
MFECRGVALLGVIFLSQVIKNGWAIEVDGEAACGVLFGRGPTDYFPFHRVES